MAALEDTTVTYEDLAAIERSFEDADLEISLFPSSPALLSSLSPT